MDKREKQQILSALPKVDILVAHVERQWSGRSPRGVIADACRRAVDIARRQVLAGKGDAADFDAVATLAIQNLERMERPSLTPVINATGVIVHTNLGRSPLPERVMPALEAVACGYSNLEYNLDAGRRGSRYSHVEEILCELTGAEAALVVNNNAAAVLICLETLARGREVVVSRGELVEIGGSFRIPDVMARSGAILKEVGATNRTHLRDYERAINENTALLMKVHQSNFSVVGFTSAVPMAELSSLAASRGLNVFEDLGSGTLVDFSRYGLGHEPTVQESLAAGADLVSFSGDKLLGGPQAGIIVGKREIVDRIKINPLNRAMRIDKLTLVALEQILRLYRDPKSVVDEIPVLSMMTSPFEAEKRRARRLAARLRKLLPQGVNVTVCRTVARAGGGALPLLEIESAGVAVAPDAESPAPGFSAAKAEEMLRAGDPPLIVRVEHDCLILDVRTMRDREFAVAAGAVASALAEISGQERV